MKLWEDNTPNCRQHYFPGRPVEDSRVVGARGIKTSLVRRNSEDEDKERVGGGKPQSAKSKTEPKR